MNIRVVFMLLLVVVLLGTVCVDAQFINLARRKRPGERRFGSTNYGTHKFGKNGYSPLDRNRRSLA